MVNLTTNGWSFLLMPNPNPFLALLFSFPHQSDTPAATYFNDNLSHADKLHTCQKIVVTRPGKEVVLTIALPDQLTPLTVHPEIDVYLYSHRTEATVGEPYKELYPRPAGK